MRAYLLMIELLFIRSLNMTENKILTASDLAKRISIELKMPYSVVYKVVILTLKYVKAYKKDNNVKIEYLDI
jgi:hypothetical protein